MKYTKKLIKAMNNNQKTYQNITNQSPACAMRMQGISSAKDI